MELQVTNNFSDITSEILALAKMSEQAGSIAPELYTQYDVKRGLQGFKRQRRPRRAQPYF